MSSRYMTLINIELQSLEPKDFIEPRYKDEPGDTEAGIMTEAMKRIYTLWRQTDRRTDELKLEMRHYYMETGEPKVELIKLIDECEAKSSLLQRLFWCEAKNEFSLFDKTQIGVRNKWRIVWNDTKPQMPPFLKFLFGGGEPE